MTREELLQGMEQALETGGTQAAEAFVVKHFADLPDDVKGAALLGFYAETMGKQASGGDPIVEAQQEGIEALEALEALRQEASEASA